MNKEQVVEVQHALQNIMQGCMTLNKVLTAFQIPESAIKLEREIEKKCCLRDAHVQAYKEHLALHDVHVRLYYD
jgi:hypothetical protein